MIFSAWSQNNYGETPSVEELVSLASDSNIESIPVVADDGGNVVGQFGAGGFPYSVLLGPGAEILEKDYYIMESSIEAAL